MSTMVPIPHQMAESTGVDETRSNSKIVSKGLSDGRVPAPEESRSAQKTFLIMLVFCMAVFFLVALDVTIITTALPTIAAHFKTSGSEYSWIGSAYLLASAASMPSRGKISDIFGYKPVLLVANIVFLVGSLICALAMDIKILIVGRAFQGIGGGLTSLVNICIGDLFSERLVGTLQLKNY
jgi:MFS family permease